MTFLSFLIIIGLLLVLGVVLRSQWEARQAAEAAADMADAADASSAPAGFATQLTNTVGNRLQELRNGFGGKPAADVPAQFRAWAASTLTTDPEIQDWLAALTDEQIGALADHLAEFCRDMGFELTWLLDNEVAQDPVLLHGLSQIVLLYSRASYQAVALQEEVEVFRIYHNYLQSPASRGNRELGEHLFGKLVEQGMSDITVADHMAASNRKRQQQIIDTIQHSATENPQIFNTMLKTVLIERTMPEELRREMADAVAQNGSTPLPSAAD